MLFVALFVVSVAGELEPTTTRTYDIQVPGSDPIRIIEGEPLWTTTPKLNQKRAFKDQDDPLQRFLSKYAEDVKRNKDKNEGLTTERSKSWQYQSHQNPYDDRKGWVSMEPVPWSISKISKWQSKYKPPSSKPWDNYESVETSWNKPTSGYDLYYDKPKPNFHKPTAVYSQTVHLDYKKKHDEDCNHHHKPLYENQGIITDGLPADFPQPYESNRRYSSETPRPSPFSEEGEWVLLSTTKGYKYPHQRQRSLKIKPEVVGAHRSVRLTVLPPLKNSKVNMTTSHGGLLQVESTAQTVEQAHKQYNTKKERLKKINKPKAVKQVITPNAFTTTKRNSGPDSSAVLAAVGAGMIPATMAMLVPMALSGRRKRDVHTTTQNYFQTSFNL